MGVDEEVKKVSRFQRRKNFRPNLFFQGVSMSIENTLIDELNTSENTGDIIPSVPIDLIIAQRTAGIAAFMEGLEKLREAELLFAAAAERIGSQGWMRLWRQVGVAAKKMK